MNVATHEHLHSVETAKGPSDRNFGLVFTLFFTAVALWPLRRGHPVRWWAVALAVLLLAVTALRPTLLHQFNLLWARFGTLLSRIMNPIVTAVLFYGIVTPFSWVMRMSGKDPLRLRFEKETGSYWIARTPPGPPPASMMNQF
jgi:hypothetical protein